MTPERLAQIDESAASADGATERQIEKIELGARSFGGDSAWNGEALLLLLAKMGYWQCHGDKRTRYGKILHAWIEGRREPWQLSRREAETVISILADPKFPGDYDTALMLAMIRGEYDPHNDDGGAVA